MIPIVFLDANVLFTAAHNPSGKAALVVELGTDGNWQTMTSTLAVAEARRNLDIHFPSCIPSLESLLQKVTVLFSVSGPSCPIDLPKKDRPIFLTALKCRATHLLTGDVRHFGPFMNDPSKSGGITIMTAADFLSKP